MLNYFIVDTSLVRVTLAIPRVCDTLRDSIRLVWMNPPVPSPLLAVDSSFCDSIEGAVKLTILNAIEYQSILWQSTGMDSSFRFMNSYASSSLYLSNKCNMREYIIQPYYCPWSPLGIPSAFSPNGDGINDVWGLNGAKNILIHSLYVFNRWGEKIYSSTDINFAWDGTYKGEIVPTGVYTYYLFYEHIPQQVRQEMKGTVTVLR
jgi:gliding motility-associated-like protein